VLILEDQEVLRHGLLAIASSVPEITASVSALDSFRDAAPAEFDATLLSAPTLMHAQRSGVRVEDLRPVIVIVPTSQELDIVTQLPADGYIMQADLTPGVLLATISQVMNGQFAMPRPVAAYLLHRVRNQDQALQVRPDCLSPREVEVLKLLVSGASNKEIARRLGISVHGVKRHVSTLLSHFHSPNRVHLVSFVLQSGILT
jgi:two-component system, NarL family, nitrate/nitrite response regulator NarL